jgi:hypothetical protein
MSTLELEGRKIQVLALRLPCGSFSSFSHEGLLSVLCQPLIGWMRPDRHKQGSLSDSVHGLRCRNTLTGTPRIMFDQMSRYPMSQSS